jgi:hypothetical protein
MVNEPKWEWVRKLFGTHQPEIEIKTKMPENNKVFQALKFVWSAPSPARQIAQLVLNYLSIRSLKENIFFVHLYNQDISLLHF